MVGQEFELKEVKPRIFLLKFKDGYKLAMHFLRYQEYYESPFEGFRGHPFALLDYMDHYVTENKTETFDYPAVYAGFNIPGQVIGDVRSLGIPDANEYDRVMYGIYSDIQAKNPDFYLIGAQDDETIEHEVAHGLWYTTPEYQEKMRWAIAGLPPKVIKFAHKHLKKFGYCEEVFDDEIQAYFATGLMPQLEKTLTRAGFNVTLIASRFETIFKEYR